MKEERIYPPSFRRVRLGLFIVQKLFTNNRLILCLVFIISCIVTSMFVGDQQRKCQGQLTLKHLNQKLGYLSLLFLNVTSHESLQQPAVKKSERRSCPASCKNNDSPTGHKTTFLFLFLSMQSVQMILVG